MAGNIGESRTQTIDLSAPYKKSSEKHVIYLCCLFKGGNNAGHTVVVDSKEYFFHMVPR